MKITLENNMWIESLYINGERILVDISLYPCEVLEEIIKRQDGSPLELENVEIDKDWLEERGKKQLPKNLKDLKLNHKKQKQICGTLFQDNHRLTSEMGGFNKMLFRELVS